MKTFFAYAIVLVCSQFMLTLGVLVVSLLSGFLFFYLPEKLRSFISPFLGGIAGLILSVLFGYWIFRLLLGPSSFGGWPFLCCIFPLLIPINNDLKKYKQLKRSGSEILESTSALTDMITPTIIASKAVVLGEISGIIIVGIWFLFFFM